MLGCPDPSGQGVATLPEGVTSHQPLLLFRRPDAPYPQSPLQPGLGRGSGSERVCLCSASTAAIAAGVLAGALF